MRRLLRWLLLVPVGILLVVFAVANRAPVVLSLDPFSREASAFAITMPLFVALLLALIAGVVIGGIAAGLGRMRWRYRARRAQREADRLRSAQDALPPVVASGEAVRLPAAHDRQVALR